jgi:putative membrane protein insertion efficiency factor
MRKLVDVVSRAVGGVLILFVRAYQMVLSPHIGKCCRFEPSCSAYCIEALRVHGVFTGCWLAFRRVMRCRPFGPSGYDPVPPRKSGK